jgi:hypothetical protein
MCGAYCRSVWNQNPKDESFPNLAPPVRFLPRQKSQLPLNSQFGLDNAKLRIENEKCREHNFDVFYFVIL